MRTIISSVLLAGMLVGSGVRAEEGMPNSVWFLTPEDMPHELKISAAKWIVKPQLDINKAFMTQSLKVYSARWIEVIPPSGSEFLQTPDKKRVEDGYIGIATDILPMDNKNQRDMVDYFRQRLLKGEPWGDEKVIRPLVIPGLIGAGQIYSDKPQWYEYVHARFVTTSGWFVYLRLGATTAKSRSEARAKQGEGWEKKTVYDDTYVTADMAEKFASIIAAKMGGVTAKMDGGAAQLISILKEYRPLLFKEMPAGVIAAALKQNETSIIGGPGPTASLKEMVARIEKAQKFMAQPITGGSQVNSLITPQTKTKDIQDTAWEIAEEIKDLLPEAAGKLIGWVGFFKEAKDKMETVRDAILLPAGAEDVYSRYKAERGTGSDQDSISAYDRASIGRFSSMVRSSPEFKTMSEDKFTSIFRQRLEARYQMDQMELARSQMSANSRKVIESIVLSYDDKINAVHRACENNVGL